MQAFEGDADKFGKFIYRVLEGLLEEGSVSLKEGCSMMLFLQCAFSSLEIDLVRKQIQTLVSLHVWHCLSEVTIISKQNDRWFKVNNICRLI